MSETSGTEQVCNLTVGYLVKINNKLGVSILPRRRLGHGGCQTDVRTISWWWQEGYDVRTMSWWWQEEDDHMLWSLVQSPAHSSDGPRPGPVPRYQHPRGWGCLHSDWSVTSTTASWLAVPEDWLVLKTHSNTKQTVHYYVIVTLTVQCNLDLDLGLTFRTGLGLDNIFHLKALHYPLFKVRQIQLIQLMLLI